MKPPPLLIAKSLRLGSFVGILTSLATLGQGMGTPTISRTGSGAALSTQEVQYTSVGNPDLVIDFGFATEEQPQPGVFSDSMTISLSGPGGTAYLVTMDDSGALWAPLVTGSLPVTDISLQRHSTSFLVPSEGLAILDSFEVDYTLPQNWQNTPLNLDFDLFDNQNGLRSLDYFNVLAVPEPSTTVLFLLGWFAWGVSRRSGK